MTTTDPVPPVRDPRRAALDRETAMLLAATEYRRYLDQLRVLDPGDWNRPTDCPLWDVREMATHSLGMARLVTSADELMRQVTTAAQRGPGVDHITALQVEEGAHLRPAQIVAAYAAGVEPAALGRRARAETMDERPMPEHHQVNGVAEGWTFGFLFDVILTRDTWMHRVDIARATGKELELTADHDGVLVADIVAEWAGRHGRPFALTLTGPAGGSFARGAAAPASELDAVEFCRIVSRRAPGAGLLETEVPF